MFRWQSVMELATVYRWVQRILGGQASQRYFVDCHLRPQPGDRLLDIGCGPAGILERLPQVSYVGVDLSPRCIAAAQARYGERGTFVCQSVSQMAVDQPHSFDLVMAAGLLHHLDNSEADQLFKIAALALKPGGRFVTLDGCFVPGQSKVAQWLLRNDRGQFVRTAEGYLTLANRVFSDVRPTVRHDLLRTPYTHIMLECQTPVGTDFTRQ